MRSKPATWSTEEDKERKFDRLLRLLVADEALLSEVARITPVSSGASVRSVDGVGKRMFEAHLFQYE